MPRMIPDSTRPAFAAPYAQEDELLAAHFLAHAGLDTEAEARIDRRALRLIAAVRAKSIRIGGVEDLLREYSLSSEEGLALMVLAESLLRVPDDLTADRLIEDKLASARWSRHGDSEALLVAAAAWALGITARVIGKGKSAEGVLPRWRAGSAWAPCALPRGGPCSSWGRISSSVKRSRPPWSELARERGGFIAILSICWAKARGLQPAHSAILHHTRMRLTQSVSPPNRNPCRSGPAFP